MIDYFALALTHGLIALAVIRLMLADAVDSEPDPGEPVAEPDPRPRRKHKGRPGRDRGA